ncbi:MAG: choice-of-anchor D domain-containing protein, partial [Verrucomicrobia bacterium]|nr:choice-of-anchor D domain-containing protein [Verrucomicrobiota bacterium]
MIRRFADCLGLVALVGVAAVTPASGMVYPDYVLVGNPGNAADTSIPESPRGAVGYEYRIGKYEITNAQYAAFLNAVAKTDPHTLYNPAMGLISNGAGGIIRSGSDLSYTYAPKTNMGNKPVNYVSWFDAARFCNWMHNGQGSGSTETGAYLLNGATTGKDFVKQTGAKVWIPSEDEWYKAAYYDPTAGAGGGDHYWLYPTRSNTVPIPATTDLYETGDISNPAANVANYNSGAKYYVDGYFMNGTVTTAGSAGVASTSYYGTFDQGGNVAEWNDAISTTTWIARGLRGGSWKQVANFLLANGIRQTGNFCGVLTEDNETGFRIAGFPEPPTIIVEQPLGTVLTSGSSTVSFGSGLRGGAIPLTFTIRNTGSEALTSLALSTAGTNRADFVVTTAPATSVAACGSTTFTVTFTPAAIGTRVATLHIASNASTNNPFNINLTGTGSTTAPVIVVEQPSGTGLTSDFSTVSFGSAATGVARPLTFTIRNTGSVPLSSIAISMDGGNAEDYRVSTPPATTVATGGSTTFVVTFTPSKSGTRVAALHLTSNDMTKNPFTINLTGTCIVPQIVVEQPLGNSLAINSTVSFGTSPIGVAVPLTFTIRNTGAATLTISPLTTDFNPRFVINSQPATSVVAGGSTTFLVTFTPLDTSTQTDVLHIACNDQTKLKFTLSLTGSGGSAAPVIAVEQPLGTTLPIGTGVVDFGSGPIGVPRPLTLTIRNTGNAALTSVAASTSGTNAANYVVTTAPATTVAAGGSTTFVVTFVMTFTPSASGTRTTALHIASSDTTKNPFNINLTGTGTAPLIAVEQPLGTALISGTSTVHFGSGPIGVACPLTFTIRNTGNATLTSILLSTSGTNAADYVVTTAPASTVAAGGSTTFVMTFTPSASGTRTAALHIASSDTTKNPFNINLTGTGTAPVIVVEQPLGTTLISGTSTVDFGSGPIGVPRPLTFTIRNTGAATLAISPLTTDGNPRFVINSQPATSVVAGGSTTFLTTFTPLDTSTQSEILHISCNDTTKPKFHINLTGTGTAPVIAVEQPLGTPLTSGSSTVNFGSGLTGVACPLTFTIRNTGSATLTSVAASTSGTNTANYVVTTAPTTTVAAGGSTTFTVAFTPSATGTRAAVLHIASSDTTNNPFLINLTGTGTAPLI